METVQNTELLIPKLKEWLQDHGIKAVLFDLDDTLLDTYPMMQQYKRQYADEILKQLPQVDKETFWNTLERLDVEVDDTVGVGKERWAALIDKLIDVFGPSTTETLRRYQDILETVHQTAPPLIPGAQETLRIFQQAIGNIGIVTHGDPDWTKIKIDTNKLRQHVTHIQSVDPTKHKNAEDWKDAITAMGISSRETLVVGDGISGDITAAREAGVQHLVWIPGPWGAYDTKKTIPEGTMKADHIGTLISTLLSMN